MASSLLGDFKTRAATPFFWFVNANQLLTSGLTLLEQAKAASDRYFAEIPKATGRHELTAQQKKDWPKIGMTNVAPMLLGLALEVLIKGYLIARNPSLVEQQRIAARISADHKLQALFVMAGIPASAAEGEVLDQLTESVTWAARYPVPRSQNDFRPRALPTGGYTFPGAFGEAEIRILNLLWNRVQEAVASDPVVTKYVPL